MPHGAFHRLPFTVTIMSASVPIPRRCECVNQSTREGNGQELPARVLQRSLHPLIRMDELTTVR
jgi:hypothetical protein